MDVAGDLTGTSPETAVWSDLASYVEPVAWATDSETSVAGSYTDVVWKMAKFD